ncbi:MAG: DUF58 domain-containing protein, partial [Pseudomonadota bacterium]
MRPSRRLLIFVAALLGLTALIISSAAAPPALAFLLWAALAMVMLADLAISPSRRSITVEVDGPDEVFSGEDAIFKASLQSRTLSLPTELSAILQLSGALGSACNFTLTGSSRAVLGTARVPARRRGIYELPALWLSWPSRLGLFEFTPKIALDTVLKVIPNIRPVLSGQIDVRVQSDLYGVKENALVGEGSEFHQMRDFMPGMDTRGIDWKRSARRRDLVVKEMQSERNHQIILALDNGYLMREELDGLPKIDHAVNAALATAWAAGIGGDLVGLYSFDAVPRVFVPPRPGRAAFPALRAHTAEFSYDTASSNPTLALAHLNGRLNRRSLIIIFSDFDEQFGRGGIGEIGEDDDEA